MTALLMDLSNEHLWLVAEVQAEKARAVAAAMYPIFIFIF